MRRTAQQVGGGVGQQADHAQVVHGPQGPVHLDRNWLSRQLVPAPLDDCKPCANAA
jgi:hypothetical protein